MFKDILASWGRLPTWVQWWVGALVAVNSVWLLLLETPTGQATGVAAVFVLLTNGPIVARCRGMNRLMSIPHLIAWIPLEVFLVLRLFELDGQGPMPRGEEFYAVTVVLINGVSLLFDVADSWRWLRGERETI